MARGGQGRIVGHMLIAVAAMGASVAEAPNAAKAGYMLNGAKLEGSVVQTSKVANASAETLNLETKVDDIFYVNPRNLLSRQGPSEMSGSKIKRLSADMKENGYNSANPIEVASVSDRLVILDGHHRTAAAIKAKINAVPVKEKTITPEQVSKLTNEIADAMAERALRRK